MTGGELYLALATVLIAVGLYRQRPGWFVLGAILSLLAMYASAFVEHCAYASSSWSCYYSQRMDILVGGFAMLMVSLAGMVMTGLRAVKNTLKEVFDR